MTLCTIIISTDVITDLMIVEEQERRLGTHVSVELLHEKLDLGVLHLFKSRNNARIQRFSALLTRFYMI